MPARRRTIAIVRRLCLAALAVAACHRHLPPEFPGGTHANLRVEKGHVLVRADVHGQRLLFLVDTGASITSVTPAVARRLALVDTGLTVVRNRPVPTTT